MHRGKRIAAEGDAGREAHNDRPDSLPHRAHRLPIDDEHVEVDEYLDQHERGVEHPVREEHQADRDGERGKAITQRTVDERRQEGNRYYCEDAGLHSRMLDGVLIPTKTIVLACYANAV